MEGRYYFISDAHLGMGRDREGDRKREARLLSLLSRIEEEASRHEVLGFFIVGDLFDSWFEFRTVVPRRHIRTLAAIANIRKHAPVDYLMGNHDFGHQDFFRDELGVQVYEGDIERRLFDKKCYIAHGDGKAKNDAGYLFLRKVLRNKLSLFMYGLIHPDLGIPFAEWVSSGSRGYTDQRQALQKQDGMIDFAKEKIEQEGFEYVIMGHRHKPQTVEFMKGTYVNLGDWLTSYSYGVMDSDGLRLKFAVEE